MPSSTFFKLKPQKRSAFIEVALTEFAFHGYETGSISNIVKTLQIAKGSVYQYFENKLTLYEYLVKTAASKYTEITNLVDSKNQPLKLWFMQRTMAEIKFAEQFKTDFLLLQQLRFGGTQETVALGNYFINQEKANVKKVVGSKNIDTKATGQLAFIIYTVKNEYVKNCVSERPDDKKMVEELSTIADILMPNEP